MSEGSEVREPSPLEITELIEDLQRFSRQAVRLMARERGRRYEGAVGGLLPTDWSRLRNVVDSLRDQMRGMPYSGGEGSAKSSVGGSHTSLF